MCSNCIAGAELALNASQAGVARDQAIVSFRGLADATEISEPTVRRLLYRFETAGLISREPHVMHPSTTTRRTTVAPPNTPNRIGRNRLR